MVGQVDWSENQVTFRNLSLDGQLEVPAGILGSAAWSIDSESVHWRQQSQRGQGRLRLSAQASSKPGANALPLKLFADVDLGVSRVLSMALAESLV